MNDRDPDHGDEARSLDDLDLFQEDQPEEQLGAADGEPIDAPADAAWLPPEGRRGGAPGTPWFVAGVMVAVAGVGLAVWSAASPATAATAMEAIGRAGLAPIHLLFTGLLICGFCAVQSHLDRRLRTLEEESARKDADLHQMVGWLVEAQETRNTSSQSPALEIATFLQTHEDKINNLTRALKLYGKPLVEITNKITDTHRQLGDLQRAVAGLHHGLEVNAESLRRTVREELQGASDNDDARLARELHQVLEATRESRQELEELGNSLAEQLRAALAPQLDELKSAIATAPAAPAQAPEASRTVDETPSPLEQATRPRNTDRDSFLGAVAKLKQLRS